MEMAEIIFSFIYLLSSLIIFLIIRKYVFFEPDWGVKKQRVFNGISFVILLILWGIYDTTIATSALQLIIGINIFLARKKHKIRGFLVGMIPLSGIANGLLFPFIYVQYALGMSEQTSTIYACICTAVIFLLLVIFYVKGKTWRIWFNENMQYRSLDKSEKWLLWAVGIMMQFFIYVINLLLPNNYTIEHQELAEQISIHLLGSSFEMFFMTAVIIGLILRGNQQSFYHKKVSGMQSGMITLMADIVENRDDNTGGHIKRTARYVEGIAKELIRRGVYKDILTDEYMQDLIVAAPLHDIGKIHVPDAVLNKPGKLTNDEFDIMKAHTTTGEKLLDHAKEELGEYNYLTIAVEMATYHHEWWNGKGYPYGISGEEIPLCARIMAVADVFDALISKRVYKDPMPLEKAYAIIREESGTHFEPQIVDAFFAVVDDMIVEE